MTSFDSLFKGMRHPLIAASYIGFVVLSFFYFDKPIAYFFHGLGLKIKMPLIQWITNLGKGYVAIGLFFLLAMTFRYIYRNKQWEIRTWFLWLCLLIPNVICLALKVLIGRARPYLLFENDLYGFYGIHANPGFWSLPSGHTTTVMGLVFGLCIVFPRYFYAFILSGLVVISTRVILTDHYLSDVLATSYLTLFEVSLLLFCLRRKGWLAAAFPIK